MQRHPSLLLTGFLLLGGNRRAAQAPPALHSHGHKARTGRTLAGYRWAVSRAGGTDPHGEQQQDEDQKSLGGRHKEKLRKGGP